MSAAVAKKDYQFVISAHGVLTGRDSDYIIPYNTVVHTYKPGTQISCPPLLQTKVCLGEHKFPTHNYRGPIHPSKPSAENTLRRALRDPSSRFDVSLTGNDREFKSGLVLCNPPDNKVIHNIDENGPTTLSELVEVAYNYVKGLHPGDDFNFSIHITLLSCLEEKGGGRINLNETGRPIAIDRGTAAAPAPAAAGAATGGATACPKKWGGKRKTRKQRKSRRRQNFRV